MIQIHRSLVVLVVLALVLPACGGSGPPTSSSTPPPAAPTRTLVDQGSRANIPPFASSGGAFFALVFQLTGAAGTLEATVDWTFASSPVNIGWATGNCLQNPNCTLITQNTGGGKPKTVTAVNQQPGTYSLVVVNNGTSNEAISYQIFLIR